MVGLQVEPSTRGIDAKLSRVIQSIPTSSSPSKGQGPSGSTTVRLEEGIRTECNIPGCKDEGIQSELGSNYCKEHTRRYELFAMGVLPDAGTTTMTETLFAVFDYLMEEIDKLNTELAMYRITKKYTGEESGDHPGADRSDVRHRYAKQFGKPNRRLK